jgi:hypothetical protein
LEPPGVSATTDTRDKRHELAGVVASIRHSQSYKREFILESNSLIHLGESSEFVYEVLTSEESSIIRSAAMQQLMKSQQPEDRPCIHSAAINIVIEV